MDFKDRIKSLRTERGLTQTDLASTFGKTESAARAWELGRTKPDADTLIKLAQYFDCTTDYLLGISLERNHAHGKQLELKNKELAKALARYENWKLHGDITADVFLTDVLNANQWFVWALQNVCKYTEFTEEKSDDFIVLKGIAYKDGRPGEISEVEPPQLLDHFLVSAQNQIANVCRFLRKKRWPEAEDGETNAKT